ncbi:flagellar biosynthesis regulator FlaF [Trichlorobacter lovleyi]|jgi:Flagellar biosynthesis regulator FlaF|uniref:Flagellar FlaF family protein n=1 Tax=Trichlorobacter lovleyi (strain ATCC BAA-1151 / DSM 17278 / SZ) TaxID=398767 RepID=B3EBL8_TRIL1|nr:flagellar biosynthesis regulator FlaF [Trichlorobacter lovleyi]ACD97057.1 flagellar FlaF family protein [Trichlorobacter lovleyi SZ]
MSQTALNSYTSMQKETLSGRELEASVLTRAGLMLKQVQENWAAPDRDEKLLEAIKFNQKVWSFFQAELSDPENPLPTALKQDILNLSLFIDKRLFEVMADPDKDKLTIVVDIDFNIAAGLRTKAE